MEADAFKFWLIARENQGSIRASVKEGASQKIQRRRKNHEEKKKKKNYKGG